MEALEELDYSEELGLTMKQVVTEMLKYNDFVCIIRLDDDYYKLHGYEIYEKED